jgi:hypothetical protein
MAAQRWFTLAPGRLVSGRALASHEPSKIITSNLALRRSTLSTRLSTPLFQLTLRIPSNTDKMGGVTVKDVEVRAHTTREQAQRTAN